MENMKWNKLTARPLDEEEKEYYKKLLNPITNYSTSLNCKFNLLS